jgi:hypothetical protein
MWSDNPLFWESLDSLVQNAWRPLKEFLDVCREHEDEFTLQTNALLFGGLGTFVRKYAMMRADLNSHQVAFEQALIACHSDHRMRAMMGQAADMMVDNAVEKMKEGNE